MVGYYTAQEMHNLQACNNDSKELHKHNAGQKSGTKEYSMSAVICMRL